MRWYGDNSELNGIWNAKMPDILLFGGIAISDAEGRKLTDRIREVKRRYSEFGAFPIKWNFMDVERWFKNRSGEKTFSQLKAQSKQWRRSIIDCALDIEFTVIIACVKHHSVQRHVIKKTRSSVAQFAFADALMRVGLLATEVRPDGICVVLDWPDAGKYQVFTDEYRSALWKGTCHYSPGNSYFCGALHKLRFEEQILFTKMEDCPLLQFSDLILGAVRPLTKSADI